jgi:hypothetical protein
VLRQKVSAFNCSTYKKSPLNAGFFFLLNFVVEHDACVLLYINNVSKPVNNRALWLMIRIGMP